LFGPDGEFTDPKDAQATAIVAQQVVAFAERWRD
jgi:hypothetical protein